MLRRRLSGLSRHKDVHTVGTRSIGHVSVSDLSGHSDAKASEETPRQPNLASRWQRTHPKHTATSRKNMYVAVIHTLHVWYGLVWYGMG